MSTLLAPVAVGELIDKITILAIKNERITDPEKLTHVKKELELLTQLLHTHVESTEKLITLQAELKRVNEILWEIEDDIRDCERAQRFDDKFVQLARSVYITNDKRCDIKRQINELTGSTIFEVKSYADYQSS